MSLSESYLPNLDWLAFSYRLNMTVAEELSGAVEWSCPEGMRIELLPGTNVYKQRCIVYDWNGDKCLTLLAIPYSSIIDKRIALVEVANQWLYSRWWDIVDLLPKLHAGTINTLSRVDICVDFPASLRQAKIIEQLYSGEIYVQGKHEGSCFWDATFTSNGYDRKPNCMSWGGKKSVVKWKLYNKSKEIHEWQGKVQVATKPYIVEEWHRAGWSEWGVWRLEVSLLDAGQFVWDGFPLDNAMLQSYDRIEQIFRGLYDKRFVQRLNEGHADRSNDERVYLLRMGSHKRLRKREPLGEATSPEGLSQLRSLLKQLSKPSTLMNEVVFGALATAATAVADEFHLHSYVEHSLGAPLDAVLAIMYAQSGSGIHEYDGMDIERLIGE